MKLWLRPPSDARTKLWFSIPVLYFANPTKCVLSTTTTIGTLEEHIVYLELSLGCLGLSLEVGLVGFVALLLCELSAKGINSTTN